MSGFWAHAFSSIGDNVELLNDVAGDVQANLNPFSADFLSGNAKQTAAEVERQLARDNNRPVDQARIDVSASGGLGRVKDAGTQTVHEVAVKVGEGIGAAGKVAGGALDILTNPWFLGGAALLIVAALAAPYVAPVLARLK